MNFYLFSINGDFNYYWKHSRHSPEPRTLRNIREKSSFCQRSTSHQKQKVKYFVSTSIYVVLDSRFICILIEIRLTFCFAVFILIIFVIRVSRSPDLIDIDVQFYNHLIVLFYLFLSLSLYLTIHSSLFLSSLFRIHRWMIALLFIIRFFTSFFIICVHLSTCFDEMCTHKCCQCDGRFVVCHVW